MQKKFNGFSALTDLGFKSQAQPSAYADFQALSINDDTLAAFEVVDEDAEPKDKTVMSFFIENSAESRLE